MALRRSDTQGRATGAFGSYSVSCPQAPRRQSSATIVDKSAFHPVPCKADPLTATLIGREARLRTDGPIELDCPSLPAGKLVSSIRARTMPACLTTTCYGNVAVIRVSLSVHKTTPYHHRRTLAPSRSRGTFQSRSGRRFQRNDFHRNTLGNRTPGTGNGPERPL